MFTSQRWLAWRAVVIRVHFPLADGKKPHLGFAGALGVGGSTRAVAGGGPEYSKYDRLNAEAPNAFEVVDLDQADVVVYPYRAESGPAVDNVAEAARQAKHRLRVLLLGRCR